MRHFLSHLVVRRLLILLTTATVVASLDPPDFSATLEQVVDNLLGAKEFKVINSICRSPLIKSFTASKLHRC